MHWILHTAKTHQSSRGCRKPKMVGSTPKIWVKRSLSSSDGSIWAHHPTHRQLLDYVDCINLYVYATTQRQFKGAMDNCPFINDLPFTYLKYRCPLVELPQIKPVQSPATHLNPLFTSPRHHLQSLSEAWAAWNMHIVTRPWGVFCSVFEPRPTGSSGDHLWLG